MKNTKKRGFTIVELVIVIAVIAILASVLIPTFTNVVKAANKSKALQEARNAYTDYLAKYVTENNGSLPGNLCIKSGTYYFEVKAGQFTGNKCSNGSAHKYYTISNGALVGPGTEDHTATTTTTTTTTQPAGGVQNP